eukprot:TRINITY_DN5014_c0_g2_i1.p1 TRINITY_DN5014_c0_g2~~TRINITY_DN5014_c0_g2_i1.p1  ORF type:complete len:470 (-),score=112.36 TRINITY_DN5014_c0_g2_i1:36-1445(-)
MKMNFGSSTGKKTLNEARKEARNEERRRAVPQFRHKTRTMLVKPKEHWPPISPGISMEADLEGNHHFKIVWTPEYQLLQQKFFVCVNSMDPSSFQTLLAVNPYHVDSLLQLSEVCKQTGQFETAMDFLERCVYAFECSWHPMFNPVSGTCRLDYRIEENKTFFLVLFKYIQMLGREGCSRTAIEYCKLLWALDLDDPLSVSFLVDYYAIRSQQYEWLLKLVKSPEVRDKNLKILPNFAYSTALARFRLEQTSAAQDTTADESLQEALMLFPMVLEHFVKKGSLNMMDNGKDMSKHNFFAKTHSFSALEHVVKLYVERGSTLWKEVEVVKWLKKNVKIVLERVEKNDPVIQQYEETIKREYEENPKNLYNHLVLSEFSDSLVNALPPELAEAVRRGDGGVRLYENFQEPPPRVVHAQSANVLAQFLQTLMPWNPVPNAPPVDGGGQGEWMQQLLDLLQQRAQEPDNQDEE